MRPKFHVGDVVRVVHHFDHSYRPSPEADGKMSGNLRAVISKVSRLRINGIPNYSLVWLGKGIHARVLPSLDGSSTYKPLPNEHRHGDDMSWWTEDCLQLVRRRPKLPAEIRLVLKTELGD